MDFPFRSVRKDIKGNMYLQFIIIYSFLMDVNDDNPEFPLLLVLVKDSHRVKFF